MAKENWVTINGVHVLIGGSGRIEKGPAKWIGSKASDLQKSSHTKRQVDSLSSSRGMKRSSHGTPSARGNGAKKTSTSKSSSKKNSDRIQIGTSTTYSSYDDFVKGGKNKTSTPIYGSKKKVQKSVNEALDTANKIAKGVGGSVPKSVKDFTPYQKELYNYLLGLGMTPKEAKDGVIETVVYQNKKKKK